MPKIIMPRPWIVRVVEIKRQIDLVYVILSNGKYAFRSKSDLTPEQTAGYYDEIRGDCLNPFEQDAEAYTRLSQTVRDEVNQSNA